MVEMAGATIFKSLAGIMSGPVAFLSSSPDNFLSTSSSVILLKLKLVETGVIWNLEVEGDGTATTSTSVSSIAAVSGGT